ncbi:proton-conducting transporter membrane subunit [Salinirubrum litoreum]|uniref:Proton-conducting transporter membrane subunit n=1 Tax=Salinirubrum litoreum TaxID=1126234 RepID=A0ABD5RF71_9EURY
MSVLLALLVAVPLLAAVLPLFLAPWNRRVARGVVLAALLAQIALAGGLAWRVLTGGATTYVIGAIPASFGIGLAGDRLTAVLVVLVALAGLGAYLVGGIDRGPAGSLWLLLVAGLTGVVVTADVFNLYVFLEISGLAAYALVASARDVDAAVAAFTYLLVGTVGATLYLLGVGYVFVATGTLAMADIAVALPTVGYDSTLVIAGFVLMAVGLSVKLALFPLHSWKPAAYASAPPAVAAMLAALGSTVAGYALLRLTYGVFGVAFLGAVPTVQVLLVVGGLVSVVAGGVLALRATDVRRLLAYSSVSQFGLFAVGLALATPLAVAGALVTLVGHAVAKGGLFVAAGALARAGDLRTLDDYAGLGRRAPVVAGAIALLGTSLVGLPPTVGFAGKYLLALGGLEQGSALGLLSAGIVVLSTLLSLAYVGRLVERLYLGSPPGATPTESESATDRREGADAATDGGVSPSADGGVSDTDADASQAGGDDGVDPISPATPALVVLVVAAVLVLALGLGSSALTDWLAPVVEGWL